MALTRKMLKAWGIEEDKIDLIVEGNADSLKAKEAEKDKVIAQLQSELDEMKSKGDDGLQATYDKLKADYDNLQAEFNDYKDSITKKETLEKKKTAYRELAKDSGLSEKGIEKALKYADYDSIELNKDGTVKNANDHISSLKEEWSEYVVTEGTSGADTVTPPSNSGSKMTKDDIMNIKDSGERQKAIAENHELFGF